MNSIKVTIENEAGKYEIDYPCLMIAKNGDIVLFSEEGTGTLIHMSPDQLRNKRKIGHVSDAWFMPTFVPFKGKLIMEVT